MDPWQLSDSDENVSVTDLQLSLCFDEEDQAYVEDDNSEHLDKRFQQP
jgi:hypothetical protein